VKPSFGKDKDEWHMMFDRLCRRGMMMGRNDDDDDDDDDVVLI